MNFTAQVNAKNTYGIKCIFALTWRNKVDIQYLIRQINNMYLVNK